MFEFATWSRRCLMLTALMAVAMFPALAAQAQPARLEGDDKRDHVRLFWAKSSESDFVTVVIGDYDASQESNYILGANWGRDFTDTFLGLPFRTTLNVGLQHLAERGYQDDGYGITAFIKAHYDWNIPKLNKQVQFGLGEGLSYADPIPISEKRDFAKKNSTSEHLMNYLEWTIDVPLRQFDTLDAIIPRAIDDVTVGFMVFHRSSVFGLFADEQGGVNFMGFSVQASY